MVMTQVQEQSKLEPSIKPFFLEHTRELCIIVLIEEAAAILIINELAKET